MSTQPIGYTEPAPGQKLALGLADPMAGGVTASSVSNTTTQTASYLGGTIFTGFGQAPQANSFARITGLNAT